MIPKVNRPVKITRYKGIYKDAIGKLRIPESGPLTPRLREKQINTQVIGFKYTPPEPEEER